MTGRGDRLLVACLGGGGEGPRGAEEWREVLLRSLRHDLSAYLCDRLRRSGADVPAEVAGQLRRLYLETSGTNTGLFHHLSRALVALKGRGIPVIVLKGAHLAEGVYGNRALRKMSDVDLLVRREDFDGAKEALLDAGYPPQGPHLPVDIHWALSAARRRLAVDLDGVWERAVPVTVAGVEARGLSPEDLVLHVCTHLSYQHLFESAGLRTLVDIRETAAKFAGGIDWEAVARRAGEWNNGPGVHLALLLARDIVGAGIPGEALGMLRPRDFDAAMRDWAVEQIFRDGDPGQGPPISPYFWQLWKRGPLREKAASLRMLVLPDREFIGQRYPVAAGARRIPLFYGIRFARRSARYAAMLWKIATRDRATLARAARVNANIAMRDRLASR